MNIIADKNMKILILGSYPGEVTIRRQEYYSHSGNQFWKLLGIDRGLDYESKKRELLKRGIGVWDMFESVERKGSSDKNIKSGVLNDFKNIWNEYDNLDLIVINGKGVIKKCKKIVGKEKVEEVLEIFRNRKKEVCSSSGAGNGKANERAIEWGRIF